MGEKNNKIIIYNTEDGQTKIERLAEGKVTKGYFEEFEERVRKIRTSESNFYQKVRDIFATSADYNPKLDYAKQFFACHLLNYKVWKSV